jgi:glycosyltransferase involved in cell wall biosynthesis
MTLSIPVSAIVPTRNRSLPLTRMLQSLAQQSAQPVEMIVVDASTDGATAAVCRGMFPGLITQIVYHRAIAVGAATQRNQAVSYATQPLILFADDDIFYEIDCILRLWQALEQNPKLGGVCTLITNCHYSPPGRVSRVVFQVLHGRSESSFAGRCIGPALNLLPEDRADLPEVVPVEWMNTTCTLYRREAMPEPPFPTHFTGYSLMEDVTLSLLVGKQWQLANARTARIFHDSQPGDHKNDRGVLAKMELVNRHYVMTQILQRRSLQDHLKLVILQLFEIAASLFSRQGWQEFPALLSGKLAAIRQILTSDYSTTHD